MSTLKHLNFIKNFDVDPETDESLYKYIFLEPPSFLLDEGWKKDASELIHEYRGIFKSSYIRWSLAINGLHLAQEKYNDPNFKNVFQVTGLRRVDERITRVGIIAWRGKKTAETHFETIPMLVSYGIIDLYSLIEEFILVIYRTYLFYNPETMLIGSENKTYRKLYRAKDVNPEKWIREWNKRLDNWQRRKIYDGLDNVYKSFLDKLEINKTPKHLIVDEEVKPEIFYEIANIIKFISVLRNTLIHGNNIVTKELEDASNLSIKNDLKFIEGETINLESLHLSAIEQVSHSLLAYYNIALLYTKK